MGIKDKVISAVLGAAASAAWDAISGSASNPMKSGDGLLHSLGSESLADAIAKLKIASSDSAFNDAFKDAFNAAISGSEAKELHAVLVDQARAKRAVMDAGSASAAEARKTQELSLFKRKAAEDNWKKGAKQLLNALTDFKGSLSSDVKASVLEKLASLAANDKATRAPAAEKDPEGWASVHEYAAQRESLNELSRVLSKR